MTTTFKNALLSLIFAVSFCGSASADIVFLDNSGTGALLDEIAITDLGTAAATVAVTEIPGLNLTVVGINSDAPTTSPDVNVTGTSLGINAGGDADTDAFESAFGQSVTFQFDQDVEISQLDFTTFTAGETFVFGGVTINNGDLSNGTTDVYDFSTPLAIAANTPFTLEATAGTIGIEAFDVTVAVPEPSTLAILGIGCLAGMTRRRKSVKQSTWNRS